MTMIRIIEIQVIVGHGAEDADGNVRAFMKEYIIWF